MKISHKLHISRLGRQENAESLLYGGRSDGPDNGLTGRRSRLLPDYLFSSGVYLEDIVG